MNIPKSSTTDTSLTSRVLKTELIEWQKMCFIQDEEFKDISKEDFQRLKSSIYKNNFTQPFYVWQSPDGKIFCLDGMHRTRALNEMAGEGVIPDLLPATFIDCKDIQEAAKLVLIYSSQYARITDDGFHAFLQEHDFNIDEILNQVSIPMLVLPEDSILPLPEDLEGEAKDKPATMKITFANDRDLEHAMPKIRTMLEEHYPTAFFSVSCGEI